MADQLQIGPVGSSNPGSFANLRGGGQADLIVSEAHARGYTATFNNQRFKAAMQAVIATATIAGLNTSITGTPVLYNPAGSNVNLVLEKVGLAFVAAPAAPLAFGLMTGSSLTAPTGTMTTLTTTSKFIGNGNPVSKGIAVISAAITLPTTPVVETVLGTLLEAAETTVGSGALQGYYDLNGDIVLAPGGYVSIWTSAVLAASSLLASFAWEEVPLNG